MAAMLPPTREARHRKRQAKGKSEPVAARHGARAQAATTLDTASNAAFVVSAPKSLPWHSRAHAQAMRSYHRVPCREENRITPIARCCALCAAPSRLRVSSIVPKVLQPTIAEHSNPALVPRGVEQTVNRPIAQRPQYRGLGDVLITANLLKAVAERPGQYSLAFLRCERPPGLLFRSRKPLPPIAVRHQFVQTLDNHGITHTCRAVDKFKHEVECHFGISPSQQWLKLRERNPPALRVDQKERECV